MPNFRWLPLHLSKNCDALVLANGHENLIIHNLRDDSVERARITNAKSRWSYIKPYVESLVLFHWKYVPLPRFIWISGNSCMLCDYFLWWILYDYFLWMIFFFGSFYTQQPHSWTQWDAFYKEQICNLHSKRTLPQNTVCHTWGWKRIV